MLMAALAGLPALLIRRRAVLAAPARYCLLVEPASAHSRPARWTRGLLYCGLPAAAFTCSWQSARAGRRGFGRYCAGTATTMLATMALAGAGFNQSPRLVNLAGLFQRASIVTGFGWLTALSAQALTRACRFSRKPST
jgi:hypothetical protein